jgi:hypothetical protein
LGVINGIITLADGHAVNNPQVPVSRLDALMLIVFCATSSVISRTFTKRRLHVVDRVALFAFIFCFFWQAAAPKMMRLAVGLALGCLLLAWACDRIRQRRQPGNASSRSNHVAV